MKYTTLLNREAIKELCVGDKPMISGFIDMETQIQPNGVDLTVNKIERFEGTGVVDFDNTYRKLPEMSQVPIYQIAKDGTPIFDLPKGCYLVTFNEYVRVPKMLLFRATPRSTLTRCGAGMHTAIWDAGFEGYSQCLLNVYNEGGIQILKNARLVQLAIEELNGSVIQGYSGIYNNPEQR